MTQVESSTARASSTWPPSRPGSGSTQGAAAGDHAAVADGNRTLLFREQYDIIDRFYVQMLGHGGLEGSVFTYLLTLAGTPSVPGAHSYPELYPLTFAARLPRGEISVRTPLADGNIAVFANRWELIDDDTLPRYVALVRDDPEQARALVATPTGRGWPATGCSRAPPRSPLQRSPAGTWTSPPLPARSSALQPRRYGRPPGAR